MKNKLRLQDVTEAKEKVKEYSVRYDALQSSYNAKIENIRDKVQKLLKSFNKYLSLCPSDTSLVKIEIFNSHDTVCGCCDRINSRHVYLQYKAETQESYLAFEYFVDGKERFGYMKSINLNPNKDTFESSLIDLSNMDDFQLFHEALGELVYRKSEIKDKILEDNFKSCEKTQSDLYDDIRRKEKSIAYFDNFTKRVLDNYFPETQQKLDERI